MNLNIGRFEVFILSGGSFLLDGGSVFGVVPKTLWSKQVGVDHSNRIEMETNCFLVRDDTVTILIESGIGYDFSEKERDIYGIKKDNNILQSLNDIGVTEKDIDIVVLTHLHFDHAGGLVRIVDNNKLVPVFPNAKHIIQKRELDDVIANYGIMKSSYKPERLKTLKDYGLLKVIDGDNETLPGIKCLITPGHCRGHQIIAIESEGKSLLFCGDLIPTSSHIRLSWLAAFDLFPYDVYVEKKKVLEFAAKEDWVLAFYHDPKVKLANIEKNCRGGFDFTPIV